MESSSLSHATESTKPNLAPGIRPRRIPSPVEADLAFVHKAAPPETTAQRQARRKEQPRDRLTRRQLRIVSETAVDRSSVVRAKAKAGETPAGCSAAISF